MVVMTVLGQVASVLQLKTQPDDTFTTILERIFGHLPETNVCSLIIGVLSMAALIGLDQVNQRNKLTFPIPRQLVIIIVVTLISFLADLNGKFELKVIGAIKSGFPEPAIPSLSRFSSMILPAATLTLIVFVNTVSIAKTMSTAHGYEAPAAQGPF
jgi:MFS superfamily sulfate permease-like transporter